MKGDATMNRYENRFDLGECGNISYTRNLGFNNVKTHFHSQLELHCVTEGEVCFTVDGRELRCQRGFIFVFPYQLHSNLESRGTKHISLIASPYSCGFLTNRLLEQRPLEPFVDYDSSDSELELLMSYCHSLYLDSKRNDGLLEAATICAVGEALRHMELIPVGDTRRLDTLSRVISYCMANLTGDLSLGAVADALNFNKCHISKVFSSKLNMHFTDFVNDQRIYRVCEELRSTQKPITQIALEYGFENQSTFNRLFMKMCGCSPREFRRRS